jgi:hypothetical protein
MDKHLCPHCGQKNDGGEYCLNCGQEIENLKHCSTCGREIPDVEFHTDGEIIDIPEFCIDCGQRIRDPEYCNDCEDEKELFDNGPGENNPFSNFEIVMFIIFFLVIAAILVPNFLRSRASGCAPACPSNCKNIGTALGMYASDNKWHYPSKLSELTPCYMQRLPTCKNTCVDSYESTYTVNAKLDAYTFWCDCNRHKGLTKGNYPQYSSEKGLVTK